MRENLNLKQMFWLRAIFILFSPMALATHISGDWSGDGYIRLNEGSDQMEYCESSRIELMDNHVTNELEILHWESCVIDWRREPLRFVRGHVYYDQQVIGSFDSKGFHFLYQSPNSDLEYGAKARIEGGRLIVYERINIPGTWWSEAYYKHQRKKSHGSAPIDLAK